MIIGVVADTHVGEFLDELPQWVLDALAGSDLILHAGDLSDGSVIRTLERIAPVVAVRGDHDLPTAPRLPRRAVVQVGRHRIGLIHGKRRSTDALVVAAHAAAGRRIGWDAGRLRAMVRAFDGNNVDAVVFGHWHEAVITHVDGVLVMQDGQKMTVRSRAFAVMCDVWQLMDAEEAAAEVGLVEHDLSFVSKVVLFDEQQ